MPRRLRTSLAALATALAVLVAAASAPAADFGEPRILRPGTRLPIDFPGFREPADREIPANHRVVAVRADLARGERADLRLTMPRGFVIRSLGTQESAEVGFATDDLDYVGHRSVVVTAFVVTRLVPAGERGQGWIYALAVRR